MRKKTSGFVLTGLVSALCLAFIIYLGWIYSGLDATFNSQERFIPSRVYSDLTLLKPELSRLRVETRLKSLNYAFKTQGPSISFQLRAPDYPAFLSSDFLYRLAEQQRPVRLQFESTAPTAKLLKIEADDEEISEVALEPELIATLARDATEIREPLQFDRFPSAIWKAIIAVEDQHFLDHKGFDPRGILRAIWVNLRSLRMAQGGSTITQQLVKNLTGQNQRNLVRKVNELFLAILLEIKYEKQQILERYLNEVYLGQIGSLQVHGVAEGARHFFGKQIEDLELAEIALLTGLIRGPFYYSPYRHLDRAVERQKVVLEKMVETGLIAQEEMNLALKTPIRLAPPQPAGSRAPYFSDFAKAELLSRYSERIVEADLPAMGLKIYTTADPYLNALSQKAVAEGMIRLERDHKIAPPTRLEGVAAVLEHRTGKVRALVGGRNYAESNFNRVLNMRRQVGSTFKPLVYLAALVQGKDTDGTPYGAAYPSEDSAWTLSYDNGRQSWSPKNYENEYLGRVSMRTALAKSINTVAAKLGTQVGIERVASLTQTFGVTSPVLAVPALSLGAVELTPLELLRIYATFANLGELPEPHSLIAVMNPDGTEFARTTAHSDRVVELAPIEQLHDMLRAVFTEGTAASASALGLSGNAAGKTGTTSDYRDAWFAGFTPELTAVVWAGEDVVVAVKDRKQLKLTGSGAALPIWVEIMKAANRDASTLDFPAYTDVVESSMDIHTGKFAINFCPEAQRLTGPYPSNLGGEPTSCEPSYGPPGPEKTVIK